MRIPSLPGVTPSAPDDRGGPDPALASALEREDRDRLLELLPTVRLIVPVVAMPAEGGGEAEMAVPVLVNAAGRRALPVFSGMPSLASWRPEARPVPMTGARVLAAAVAEGYDGVVVDVAGPAPAELDRAELSALAESIAEAPADC